MTNKSVVGPDNVQHCFDVVNSFTKSRRVRIILTILSVIVTTVDQKIVVGFGHDDQCMGFGGHHYKYKSLNLDTSFYSPSRSCYLLTHSRERERERERERDMEEKVMDARLFEKTIRDLCTRKDYPLHLAALYGRVNLVREMLSQNGELALELNSLRQSPLHLASARGHVEVVKEILNANPGACFVRDRDGMIPLHVAAIKGRVEVLEELVNANKATVFLLTESGEPILHLCAKNNKFEALMKLVDMVEDANLVNLRDQEDNTVLHLLSAKENSEVYILPVVFFFFFFNFNLFNRNIEF